MQNRNQLPEQIIPQLNLLLSEIRQLEASGALNSGTVHPEHRAGAANLIHYLALPRHDSANFSRSPLSSVFLNVA